MDPNNRVCLSAPASITSWQKKESIEIDIPCGSNGCTPGIKEIGFRIRPVSPFASGEGLPYAPIDWPRPGDNWGWKVGKRISNSGFFHDRYLYLPSRLQKPSCKKQGFAGKVAVEHYLRTEFPGANIDAFFASFIWKVPGKKQAWTNAKSARPPKVCPPVEGEKAAEEEEEEEEDKEYDVEEIPHTFPRKRKQKPAALSSIFKRRTRQTRHSNRFFPFTTKDTGVTIDLTEETGTSDPTTKDLRSSTDFESDQVSSRHNSISPAGSFVATCHSPVASRVSVMDNSPESPAGVILEDFDNYLNSLEDILAQPLSQAPLSLTVTNTSPILENEMAEARTKLSTLLAMDFPILVSTKNLSELTVLSSKLQKDPSLTADQLLKLRLIEEIPLISKDFLETKQIIEQADKFFADLEANIAKATSLRKEYNESKEKAAQLQDEIDSNSSAIREIDDQIAKLQTRRAELTDAVEFNVMLKVELNSSQRMVADSLPSVVRKVQLANSKRSEWELNKINMAKRESEILARYTPLKGFTL